MSEKHTLNPGGGSVCDATASAKPRGALNVFVRICYKSKSTRERQWRSGRSPHFFCGLSVPFGSLPALYPSVMQHILVRLRLLSPYLPTIVFDYPCLPRLAEGAVVLRKIVPRPRQKVQCVTRPFRDSVLKTELAV